MMPLQKSLVDLTLLGKSFEPTCMAAAFFFLLNRYTLVQTNVNNDKTETEIIQSQTNSIN